MTKDELDEILAKHEAWLQGEGDGERADLRRANLWRADLRDANLRDANLRDANLRDANLRDATLWDADLRNADLRGSDLRNADLRRADLRNADLRRADLRNADLRNADLRGSDLSGATGLLSQSEWMADRLERTDDGYIAYKQFSNHYEPPDHWTIEGGEILDEVVNPCRTVGCGCGVNVAVREWDDFAEVETTWRVLIRWEWLPGVVVPYHTDGKFRCERVELIEEVNE